MGKNGFIKTKCKNKVIAIPTKKLKSGNKEIQLYDIVPVSMIDKYI